MVGQRRHLLDYIKRRDDQAYRDLIAKLGLRRLAGHSFMQRYHYYASNLIAGICFMAG